MKSSEREDTPYSKIASAIEMLCNASGADSDHPKKEARQTVITECPKLIFRNYEGTNLKTVQSIIEESLLDAISPKFSDPINRQTLSGLVLLLAREVSEVSEDQFESALKKAGGPYLPFDTAANDETKTSLAQVKTIKQQADELYTKAHDNPSLSNLTSALDFAARHRTYLKTSYKQEGYDVDKIESTLFPMLEKTPAWKRFFAGLKFKKDATGRTTTGEKAEKLHKSLGVAGNLGRKLRLLGSLVKTAIAGTKDPRGRLTKMKETKDKLWTERIRTQKVTETRRPAQQPRR